MADNEPGKPGASGSDGQTQQLVTRDGKMLLGDRPVVFESDLIAAKKGLEGQLEQAQAAHSAAIDTAKLEVSDAQRQIAQLNAKLQELEQARVSGAAVSDEAAKLKVELDSAKKQLEQVSTNALGLRRANIILASGGRITEAQLKDKSLAQLDAFEEALRSLGAARTGLGAYATGGGVGGAAPETPMERAARVLASTPPVRSVKE